MSDEAGLRHKLTKKLKFAVGRAKTSTRSNDGTKKWKNSKHETDMAVSDHDERKKSFKTSSKPTRPRSGKERVDGEGFRPENSGLKRKRVFADRDVGDEGNVGKSQSTERRNDRDDSVRGRERRVDRDESYRGKERVNGRGDEAFGGRERRSDKDRGFRGKVSVRERDESFRGKERMNGRVNDGDDSNRGRERRNDRDESFRGKERMNERGDSFRGMERRGNRDDESVRGRERVNDRDDSFRGRDRRNDRDDSFRGTDRRFDRNDSFRGKEKRYGRDDSYRGREKRNDREGSVTGNRFGKGRDAEGSDFGEEKGRRHGSQPLRAGRENVVSRFGDKRSSRGVEGNARGVEVSNGSTDRTANRRVLDGKNSKNKTDPTELEDQKQSDKRETGTLEGAAKKLLRHRKSLIETAELRDGLRKKKKRGHRLDPNDISNKRIDDGISIDGSPVEKKVDQADDDEMSMNAQFRAIQPSPSILSFVEDNLLGRRRLIEFRRSGYNIDLSAPLDNVPFTTSSERERVEEPVFRNKLEFFAAAKVSSSFPPPELPEIAFAGRSNVGKSSLLNALTRQWGVVRVSDKPGLTQTINFFKLGPKLSLVDLPGYGFAYAKEEVKDAWEELVKEYVSTRVGLRRVCLLIDTKWGMKPRDHELINLMERSQTNYQIVLTKTDAVFPIDVARRAMQIEGNLKASKCLVDPVMMVSSKTGGGIRSLRTVLSKISRFAKL